MRGYITMHVNACKNTMKLVSNCQCFGPNLPIGISGRPKASHTANWLSRQNFCEIFL